MGTRDSTIEQINAGKVGMFFGAWWVSGYGIGDAYRNEPDANWQTYPIYTDDGEWNVRLGSATTGYCVINKNVSERCCQSSYQSWPTFCSRDESKLMFRAAAQLLASQNTDGSADECEYTYHELIKVLNGETKPEDYAGVSSAYKLLANDVSVIKDTVPGYEKRQTALYRRFQH